LLLIVRYIQDVIGKSSVDWRQHLFVKFILC